MIQTELLLVSWCSIALICTGENFHNTVLENYFHATDFLQREEAVTSLLEETLSQLKEQREQVGMTINLAGIQLFKY